MARRLFASLKSVTNKAVSLVFETAPEAGLLRQLGKFKGGLVEIIVHDPREVTADQRKKAFAMMHDICYWQNGFTDKISMQSTEDEMKFQFYLERNEPPFSLSNCSMETASQFIDFLIMFCFREHIAWYTQTWDMIQGDPAAVYYGIKYRECCICRNEAQWAHVHAVGSGRSRRKVDHRGNYVMPLCYKHHQEQHNIGIWSFMDKYHIKGITVDDEINAMLQYRHLKIDDADEDTRGKGHDKEERSLGAS